MYVVEHWYTPVIGSFSWCRESSIKPLTLGQIHILDTLIHGLRLKKVLELLLPQC